MVLLSAGPHREQRHRVRRAGGSTQIPAREGEEARGLERAELPIAGKACGGFGFPGSGGVQACGSSESSRHPHADQRGEEAD